MKKKILIISCIITIVILGIGYYLFTNLDSIAKSFFESVGTKVAGTKVTMESVKLSVTEEEGRVTILDLQFANPKGFSDNPMIKIGEITAHINYKTGVISKIHFGRPRFLFEQKDTRSNFEILQIYAEEQAGDEAGKPKDKNSSEVYQIDSFSIENALVSFTSLDANHSEEITVSKINFSKLNGTADQIMEQMIEELSPQIMFQVSKNFVLKHIIGQPIKAINNVLNLLGQ
jgi:hypothetical protein